MNPVFRTINFTLATILRSPLHSLFSRNLLLITVTGRKSQRPYTVPVSYRQHDCEVRIVSERTDRWWRNVRGGAPVTVQLQGHKITGEAQVLEALPEVLAQLSEHLRQSTAIAKMLHVKRDAQGQFNSDDLRRAAERSVVVRVALGQ
jgi:deazaflavin-dependent oxidoreductase (nitroreductase family)